MEKTVVNKARSLQVFDPEYTIYLVYCDYARKVVDLIDNTMQWE
jgi:hypothetical protein